MSRLTNDELLDEYPSLRLLKTVEPEPPSLEMQERVRLTPILSEEVNVDEFPSNSQQRKPSQRQEIPEASAAAEKKIEKVVSGEVVRRKQPLGKRIRATFLGGDTQSVKDYVLLEVFIPALKDTIADAVTGGIERMVFGDNIRPGGRRGSRGYGGPANRFDYAGISRGPIQQPRNREEPRQLSRRARTMHDFDEVILPSRTDAEAVLTQMFDLLDKFEVVTVSDFYELVGYSGTFTDHKYGWTDLRGTRPVRTRGGGFVLDLPPTEPID